MELNRRDIELLASAIPDDTFIIEVGTAGLEDGAVLGKLAKRAGRVAVEDDLELLVAAMERCIAGGGDEEATFRVRADAPMPESINAATGASASDGECTGGVSWVHAKFHLAGTQDGHAVMLVSCSRDNADGALSEAMPGFDSSAIVYVYDAKTWELYYANPRAIERWGRGDYHGRKCYEFIRGRKTPCPWCTGSKIEVESFAEEKYDEESNYYLDITCRKVPWHGRDVIISITRDVSQSQIAIERLEAERENLKTIIDSIPTGIFVYREDGGGHHLITSNLAARVLTDVTKEELAESNEDALASRVHPDDRVQILAALKSLVASPSVASETFRLFDRGAGQYRWLSFDAHSVRGQDNAIIVFTCIMDITPGKEIEHSLENERKAYAAAIKAGGFSVWEYDVRAHRMTLATPEFDGEDYRPLGFGRVMEDVPNSLVSAIADEDVPAFLEMHRQVEAGVPNPSCEVWFKILPGEEWKCERIQYTVVCDDDGTPVTAYGIGQNITAQKNMEERYRKELEFLRNFDAPDLIAKSHQDLTEGTVLDYVAAGGQALDVSRGDAYGGMIDKAIETIVGEEDKARLAEMLGSASLIERFMEGRTSFSLEYQRHKEGMTPAWVSTTVHTFKSPETDHVESFIYTYDLTEQMLERRIISQLMHRGYDFLCLIDVASHSYTHYEWNEGGGKPSHAYFDYDKEVVDHGKTDGIPEGEQDRGAHALSLDVVTKALETEDVYAYGFDMMENGEMRRKRMDFSYLDSSHATIIFTRSDVTKQYRADHDQVERIKQAMLEAERASQAKSTFLSSISHDMRTPLNGIIGFTGLAIAESDVEKKQGYLEKIRISGNMLLGLVNDTLDLSRIESGTMVLQREVCDSQGTLADVMLSVKAAADAKGVDFIADYSHAKRGHIRIDRVNNQKVFLNLLSNAVKFTPPGGVVRFTVEDLPELIDGCNSRMTISDTGVGISAEYLPIIFEPFVQEHDESAGDNTGTGLGLSIVKSLVTLMGGTIGVESEKGKGTTFTVLLPMDWVDEEGLEGAGALEKMALPDLSGMHVLLCEDNKMNVEIAQTMLEGRGIGVTVAGDGREGVQGFMAAAPGTYDAILMDIRMPNMNGYEAARAIRSLDRDDARTIPIIAMTADAYLEDIQRCIDAGMDSHIAKPIDPARLFRELGRLCV